MARKQEPLESTVPETVMAPVRKKKSSAILPFGQKTEVKPYTKVRYNFSQTVQHLGQPESILTDDWKREHIGWRYAWPVRTGLQTQSFIRSGWYTPVPFEAIEANNPNAAVFDLVTPTGNHVVWEQHILVAIPPERWDALVNVYEDMALSRTEAIAEESSESLNNQFTTFGYKITGTMDS